MKTYKILYKHNGENADSAKDPHGVYEPGAVDLTAQKTCCRNWDDNGLVNVNLYMVREVDLPDWLDVNDWVRNPVEWAYLWGMGAEIDWPEAWQRGLVGMPEAKRYTCAKLLKTATRSEFRKSLKAQLVAWLETAPEDRKYHDPYSPRQWDALLDRFTVRAARSRASDLYHSHRYNEIG